MNESRSEALFQKTQWVWKSNSNWKIAHIDSAISGRDVKFHSKGSFGTAIVYGDKPMSAGQYYWEATFTSPVFGTDVMLGVGTSAALQMNFERDYVKALGSDSESWGLSYRGSLWHDGKIHKDGVEYGSFSQGNVIGLHLDLWNGTLAYYIDGNYLGIAFDNLRGKILFPMACSTAAYSSLSLLCTQFYSSSLTYFSSAVLRKHVPPEINVLDALDFPPGLKKSLRQNLGWLLLPLKNKNKRNTSNHSTVGESSNNPSTRETNSSGRRRHSLFWTLTHHVTNMFNSDNSDDETPDSNAGSTSAGLARRRRIDQIMRNTIPGSSSCRSSTDETTDRNAGSSSAGLVRRRRIDPIMRNTIPGSSSCRSSTDETTDRNAGSSSAGLLRRRRIDQVMRKTIPGSSSCRSSTDETPDRNAASSSAGLVRRRCIGQFMRKTIPASSSRRSSADDRRPKQSRRQSGSCRLLTGNVVPQTPKLNLQTTGVNDVDACDSAGSTVSSSTQVVADQMADKDSCPTEGDDMDISSSTHKIVRCESADSNNKRKAFDYSSVCPQTDDAVKISSSAYKAARYETAGPEEKLKQHITCENSSSVLATCNVLSSTAPGELNVNDSSNCKSGLIHIAPNANDTANPVPSNTVDTLNSHDMSDSDSSDNEETCPTSKSFDYMMGLDCSD